MRYISRPRRLICRNRFAPRFFLPRSLPLSRKRRKWWIYPAAATLRVHIPHGGFRGRISDIGATEWKPRTEINGIPRLLSPWWNVADTIIKRSLIKRTKRIIDRPPRHLMTSDDITDEAACDLAASPLPSVACLITFLLERFQRAPDAAIGSSSRRRDNSSRRY